MGENPQIHKFELILEHDAEDEYQYKPGEQLRGEVVLVVRGVESLNARSIDLELRGEAQVSWQQRDGDENNEKDETHRDGSRSSRRQRSSINRSRTYAADITTSLRLSSRKADKSSFSPSRDLSRDPSRGTSRRRQLCTAIETYIDERRTVWTSIATSVTAAAGPEVDGSRGSDDDDRGAIVPGTHHYPFEFTLPSDMPSSFRGQHGNVGYAVRAIIMMQGSSVGRHRLAGGRAAVVSRPFYVKRRYTTSLSQTMKPLRSGSDEETVAVSLARRQSTGSHGSNTSSCEDNQGPLGARVQLDAAVVVVEIAERQMTSKRLFAGLCCQGNAKRGGRARVEFLIPTGTECRLGSYFRVDIRISEIVSGRVQPRWSAAVLDGISIEASLIQLCTFTSSHGNRCCTAALVSRRTNEGLTGDDGSSLTRRWNDVRLSVPINLPESGLPGCNIIDVSYELRFVVEVLTSRISLMVYH